MRKPSEKKKLKKFFFSAHFPERWQNHKPLSRALSTMFFLLSERSQVLTFFDPGFALLYSITYGVLHSNLIFWKK